LIAKVSGSFTRLIERLEQLLQTALSAFFLGLLQLFGGVPVSPDVDVSGVTSIRLTWSYWYWNKELIWRTKNSAKGYFLASWKAQSCFSALL
jgi:hypothetical protein